MVNQPVGNHELGIFWCGRIWPSAPPLRSNEDSQTSVYNALISGPNVKTIYRKSGDGNLLMWSDLSLGPLIKVKRG